ncbi:S1 family peptidase [Nonomuraea indica]|uniref:S1 family peptidase n=1 Tax=Nonomuraea indica TaxID=1581193 RepID=UPI001181F034|nr:S1 family peptidase [Nonomuraea indica]
MQLTRALAVSLSTLALLTCTAAPASAGTPVPAIEPVPPAPGQVSPEAQDAADAINALIESSPDQYTGVRITGPDAVTVVLPKGPDFDQRSAAVRGNGARAAGARPVSVQVEQGERSLADARRTKAEIGELIRAGTYQDKITGVGIDPGRGTAVAYATADSDEARVDLKRRFGESVVFRESPDARFTERDRSRDSAPHRAGAGIRLWNPQHTGHGGICSTSFPVVKDGIRHMLTAAHCVPGATTYPRAWAATFTSATPPSTSYYFGARVTTTMGGDLGSPTDGTQDVYGDFALLQGSSYVNAVYNCDNLSGSCSELLVGGVHWGIPTNGTSVCTSGRTTGQTCRLIITDSDWEGYVQGMYLRHMALIQSDQNGDGAYDCTTVQGGDSGGAVYNGISGSSQVRALGVISASGPCYSLFTRLSGVKAWNSSVSMPLN